jgi:DNA/RNA-binding domain of Phe-tRNA-synthetase-like protein
LPLAPEVVARHPSIQVLGRRLAIEPLPGPERSLEGEWQRLQSDWSGRSKAYFQEEPVVRAYFAFFESLGIDTKRKPPSMVNLIQRFLLKQHPNGFPTIHPIVDAVNVAAVETLIPLGVFDREPVGAGLRVAMSQGGESFLPLGADEAVELEADRLILRDNENVLSEFGIRDSQHQRIRPGTRSLYLLACQVPGVGEAQVERGLSCAERMLENFYTIRAEG